MSATNEMYRLFNTMLQGYKEGNRDTVEQCARCWMQLATENPFEFETPEHEEFFQMQRCFQIYSRGAIDQKINRRRMVEHAMKLCALDPKQPYTYDKRVEEEEKKQKLFERQKQKEEMQKEQEIKKEQPVILEEKKTVLGVIPDDQKEEKESWVKFLFPWKKKV